MRRERRGLAVVLAAGMAVLSGCAMESEAEAADPVMKKGGDNRTGHYVSAPADWWKPAPDHLKDTTWTWGQASGVVADRPDRILVGFTGDRRKAALGGGGAFAQGGGGRGGGGNRALARNLVVAVDGDGNMIENWTQWDTVIGFPHQLYISPYDPERHIWIVDRGGTRRTVHEQIIKFTNDGKQLVMQLRHPAPTQAQGGPVSRDNPDPAPYD